MEENITVRILNSNSNIPKDKRSYLTYADRHLVPCSITEDEDSFSLCFDTNGLIALNEAKYSDLDSLLFLANCSDLLELGSRYTFSIHPDNIYVDRNRIPSILNRDLGIVDEESFVKQYKALISSVVNDKYSYEDYLNGGLDLMDKDKFLAQIKEMTDTASILSKLMELYEEKKLYKEEHFELVRKGSNKHTKILLPIVSILLLASVVFSVYVMVFKIPLQEKLIDANAAYLNNDYIGVENILLDVSIDKLPYSTKYILATSYIKSADLSQEEKQNELNLITPRTDEVIFDYWIHIGRMEFEDAIDDAQRLNSDSHLYYAYLCYRDYVETDRNLTGEEKTALLSSLDEKINSIAQQLREEQNSEVIETTAETSEESETTIEETVESVEETISTEENYENAVPENSEESMIEETEVSDEGLEDEVVAGN